MHRKYKFLYVHLPNHQYEKTNNIKLLEEKKKTQQFPLKMLTWESLHVLSFIDRYK